MKIKLCSAVAGGQAGDEVDVAGEYGEWLVLKGYAVRVQEDHTQKINEENDDQNNGSSKRSSRTRK